MNMLNDGIASIVGWGTDCIINHNLDFGLSEEQVKKIVTTGIAITAITSTGLLIGIGSNYIAIRHPVVQQGNDEQNFQEIMDALDQNQN